MADPSATSGAVKRHLRVLLALTFISRLCSFSLVNLSSLLPLFDSSPRTIPTSKWIQPLLRWDAFHFARIADHGYIYEYEWAFFPGVPWLMWGAAQALRLVVKSGDPPNFLLGGAVAALACDTTCTLYRLSLHHLGSPSLAFLASILSLMPSSPATLRFAAYSEPFFTYLSYKGMLCCARSQWLAAALFFALAGTFRSNGILLSGFILWDLIIQPFLDGKKPSFKILTYSIILTSITFIPFIYHHFSAYLAFCTPSERPPAWCSNFPPSIYTHVQSKYWNVGFLRYWTLQQLPNFIIAAPPLLLLFTFSIYHFAQGFIPRLIVTHRNRKSISCPPQIISRAPFPFLSHTITPHVFHSLILSTAILLASHVQIILRLAASMPLTYWAAAWLLHEYPRCGRWWVGWSVVWGAVSVVLWGAFLPPA